jgi:hypothetical protein
MDAAEKHRWITEPMTWEEICARYPDQRVCVVEMDYPDPGAFRFRTARVVGVGTTPLEAWERATPWHDHYELFGHYFTGQIKIGPLPRIVMTDELREYLRSRRPVVVREDTSCRTDKSI